MRIRLKRDRLIELLSRSSITQNHWAMKLGLSRGHLSEILNGKHPYVSPRTRQKLLEGLGVPFDELFDVETGSDWTHQSSADFQAGLADHYLIDRELGHGGMGTVYLAREIKHGRLVAIKVMSPEAVTGVGAHQFLKEIRYTVQLEHPNILTVLDSGEAAGYPYYVMPYIRGGSLRDLLAEKGRLSLDSVVALVSDVGAALEYAHENSIVHCDLKPANILLTANHAYLADFGISRAVHAEVRAWGRRAEVDSSAGTPAYVSPEQASGESSVDSRTDVYSLGCVVFEMLTGQTPFTGQTAMEVVSKRFTSVVPNVRDQIPSLPVKVAATIERAMALESRRRYSTAAEFVDDLRRAAQRHNPVIEGMSLAWAKSSGAIRRLAGTASIAAYTGRGKVWSADRVFHDLRFAFRSLRQHLAFAAVAVLTLGLGVGANTAIFSVVNAVFFRAPTLEAPDELVEIYRLYRDGDYSTLSHEDVDDIRDASGDLLNHVIAHKLFTGQMGGAEGPGQVVAGELVSGNYFDALGVRPALGRAFLPEEDLTPEAQPVVVLSHRYWRNTMGGQSSVLGRAVRLNGQAYTVVGIAPESFPGRLPGISPDVWVPMMMENHLYPASRFNNHLAVFGRVRDSATSAQITAALRAMTVRRDAERGRTNRRWEFQVVPTSRVTLHPTIDGTLNAATVLLLVVVALVLLITCTNLASFLLARAADRKKEIAIRLALGANRPTLVRQLLTESILLGLAGGAAGLILAVWVVQILLSLEPPMPVPIALDAKLDFRVLTFTLAISLGAGVLFGLAPALRATKPDLASTLRGEAGGMGDGRRFNLRSGLVVVQIALSLFLLIGAGLFVRSLRAALDVDLGFSTDPAAILSVDGRGSGYAADEYLGFQRDLLDRLRTIPGVRQVAVTSRLPLGLGVNRRSVEVPGVPPPEGNRYFTPEYARVSPDYFDVLEIPIVRGRPFRTYDREGAPLVAIVSEALAAQWWPDDEAVGQVIRFPGMEQDAIVVGIAGTVKVWNLTEPPRPYLYVPIEQAPSSVIHAILQGGPSVPQLVGAARREALSMNPDLFVMRAHTLADHIGLVYYLPRMAAWLISVFAALALMLTCVGIYGMVSHYVARRTREMGIRIALGARANDVVRSVVWGGLWLVAVGGALGILLGLAASQLLGGLLVGVAGNDVVTFVTVPVILVAVALLASWLPARRASRVNPMVALRAE